MSKANKKVQYLITLAVCLATTTTGVFMTWTTVGLHKLNSNETSVVITKEEMSWVAALSSPGFVVGSLVSKFTSDQMGRKTTILGSAIPLAIGSISIVMTNNVLVLLVTKFLWGVGIGMMSSVYTIYLAETSDKDLRGNLSATTRYLFSFGSFLIMVVGTFVTYELLNYLILILPVMYFFACWFIPESPYYFLKERRVDEARKTLLKLRCFSGKEELEVELESMQKNVKKETVKSGSLKELLTGTQHRKAVIICIGLKSTQILSGTIVIKNYFGVIIQNSGINMELATAIYIYAGVRLVTGIVPSLLADSLGRRPLLIYSYLGTGVSLAITAAYFFCLEVLAIDNETMAPYGFVAFTGIILSGILSALGVSALVSVIAAEIFPMNVKSVAMTSMNILGGLLNFLFLKFYQQMTDYLGYFGVFTVFAVVSISGGIFSLHVIPETKGLSLSEILVLLRGTSDEKASDNYLAENEALNELNKNIKIDR